MKKIIYILLAFTTIITGCDKDPDPVSTVVTVTYPGITLNGPAFLHLQVGGTYTEEGAVLTDDITGAQSNITATSSDLDVTTEGMYKVSYVAANSNGFKTEVIRTILVLNYTPPPGLDPNYDISGDYLRAATGVTCVVAKVNNGLYIIDRVGGSTAVPAYIITPDTMSIDVPPQTSFDGFPLDVINESFTSGPPISFSYRISAENFGTGLRTFVKQ